MEIVNGTNGNTPPAEATPQTFPNVVHSALIAKGVSSICRERGWTEGWKDWEFSPAPVVTPFAAGTLPGGYVSALLLCKKCGHMKFCSLAYLGIQLEQRRIITPN